MKIHRIKALLLRHIYPLRRDFDLLSDMVYWPLIDTILWGVTSQWISESAGGKGVVGSILFALVFWNIIWRSQAEISRNLMDEIWNNNLVNIFSTPLTIAEWIFSVISLSIMKTIFSIGVISTTIWIFYQANVLSLGWWIPLFYLGATLTGWWIGFISAGIVLRYGPKVQTIIWTLPGILLPFSAIYFPMNKLPSVIQPISKILPTTYIFESLRQVLNQSEVSANQLLFSFCLNLFYLLLCLVFFVKSFKYSVKLGLGRFN